MIRSKISCLLLALALFAIPTAGQSGVPAEPETTPACRTARPLPPIPANAEQVANEIGVMPLVLRVRALASACNDAHSISVEELALRQQITEAVVTASLDVDGVLAEIDHERDRTAFAGDGVGIAGGATGVILSILGLRQQGGTGSLGIAPNMLAPIFGRTPELRSIYPQDVWAYLNTAPATDPRVHVPWRDELISEWMQAGRIGPPNVSGSQKKIDLLTSRIAEHKRLSIDLLADRSAMLLDLRARVSLMNRDLRDVMKAVALAPAH